MARRFTTVFLDVGTTLVDPHPSFHEVVARICRPGGLADADFEPVLHVKVPAIALAKANLKKMEAATVITALGARLDWTAVRGLAPIDLDDLGLAPRRAAA